MASSIRIPLKTTMGGHAISVRRDARLRGRHMLGECYQMRQEIVIADDAMASQQEETYIHELVELANGIYELGLEHRTIQTLAVALHQAFTTGTGKL